MSSLSDQVAADLRDRLLSGEWSAGQRLPGEHTLAGTYDVSRATVRTALQALESQGLTTTRHGSGTFATGAPAGIHADLRHLDSMSATIERAGARVGTRYRSREVRPATAVEAARLGLEADAPVFVTLRTLLADEEPVAHSADVLPRELLPVDVDVTTVEGSLYRFLDRVGLEVAWAIADVHAATAATLDWCPGTDDTAHLVLDQVHHTVTDAAIAWSRTAYPEGRFRFSLVRTRS